MAKLNIEELISGLLEAALVAQSISERQHINALRNYFDKDGVPKTTHVVIGEKTLEVPLYILADHGSIGLDKLEIDFEARILFGDDESKCSVAIKKFSSFVICFDQSPVISLCSFLFSAKRTKGSSSVESYF